MDVDQQELVLEVGAGEVEEESAEREVYLGLVVEIQVVYELPVGLDLPPVLVVLILLLRRQQLVADQLRLRQHLAQVLVPVGAAVLCQQPMPLQPHDFLVGLAEGLLQRQQRSVLFFEHAFLLVEEVLILLLVFVFFGFVVFVLAVIVVVVGVFGGEGVQLGGGRGSADLEIIQGGLGQGRNTSRFQLELESTAAPTLKSSMARMSQSLRVSSSCYAVRDYRSIYQYAERVLFYYIEWVTD